MSNKIIKLRPESCISESDDYYEYAKGAIIDIIDSLQQEQMEEDLEETMKMICDFNKTQTTVTMTNKALNHFFELGLKAGKEE